MSVLNYSVVVFGQKEWLDGFVPSTEFPHLAVDFSNKPNIESEIVLEKTDISNIIGTGKDAYQNITLTFTIKSASANKLVKYFKIINDILSATKAFYDDDLRPTVVTDDLSGHYPGLQAIGVSPLGDRLSPTGVLTVHPIGLSYGGYYDVLDGELVQSPTFLDASEFPSYVSKQCMLKLKVIAGARGERKELDQRLPYGNFEYPFNWFTPDLRGWTFTGASWFWQTIETANFKISGKFGKYFMNNQATSGTITAISPEVYITNGEGLSALASFWLAVPVKNFASGSLVVTLEEFQVGTSTWTTFQTIANITSPTQLPDINTWDFYPQNASGGIVGLSSLIASQSKYRIKFTCTCTGNGWSGFYLDGVALWCFTGITTNVLSNGGKYPYFIEEYVKCPANNPNVTNGNGDIEYIIYNVQGDIPVPVTLDYPATLHGKRLLVTGSMPFSGNTNEVPVRSMEMLITTTNNPSATGNFVPTSSYWNVNIPYFSTAAGTQIAFNLNLYKDRIPRNYQLWMVYATNNTAVASIGINMASEVTLFNDSIIPTTYAGAVTPVSGNLCLYLLGEWQFPQPNHTWENKTQLTNWSGKPQDKITVNYTGQANTFFALNGIIAIPTSQYGAIDTGINPSVGFAEFLMSSETPTPSSGIKQLSGVAAGQWAYVIPVQLASNNSAAQFTNGKFLLYPTNGREFGIWGQIFTALCSNQNNMGSPANTALYQGYGPMNHRLAFRYTPRYIKAQNIGYLY